MSLFCFVFLVARCFSWASSWVAPTSGEKSIQTCRHQAAPVAVGQPALCWQGRRLVRCDRMVNDLRLEPSDGRTGPCRDESSRWRWTPNRQDIFVIYSCACRSCCSQWWQLLNINNSSGLTRHVCQRCSCAISARGYRQTFKCWCWNAVWSLLTVRAAMQVRAATKHGEPPSQQRQRPVIWLHAVRDPHQRRRRGPQLQE